MFRTQKNNKENHDKIHFINFQKLLDNEEIEVQTEEVGNRRKPS